ncbi:MAG: bifunctional folylpolyglutamate synthase/dihydrofolate synthase [Deltaproteobacteria bacterium]
MQYQEAVTFLETLQFFKIKLGLESMGLFLQRLGNPHRGLSYIHIAGTNGKGSVGAALVEVLSRAGFKTGWYTSPHLSSVRERFKINGHYISEEAFARHASSIRQILDGRQITYFEFTTALAFLYFAEEKVDVVVLEVGMGGRLDATNVITPLVSVITNVAMDHEAYLGNTLAAIAFEKAGIIKEWVPVVSAVEEEEAIQVIAGVCRERKAPLYLLGRDFSLEKGEAGSFCYRGLSEPFGRISGLVFSLLGPHQRKNMALALAAIEILSNVDELNSGVQAVLHDAMRQVRWPGRVELLSVEQPGAVLKAGVQGRENVLLDGAHNPAGVQPCWQISPEPDFRYCGEQCSTRILPVPCC